MNDLQVHKLRLSIQLNQQEKQLGQQWTLFRKNFRSLIWQQVNPFKNQKIATTLLNALEPGLLPVIAEIAIGAGKGKPLNGKVLLSSVKYLVATLGIKWLKKIVEPEQNEDINQTETTGLNSTSQTDID